MALIKCKECGKKISDKAIQCINCGCPIAKDDDKGILENKIYDDLTNEERKEIVKKIRQGNESPRIWEDLALLSILVLIISVIIAIVEMLQSFSILDILIWIIIAFIFFIFSIIFYFVYCSRVKKYYYEVLNPNSNYVKEKSKKYPMIFKFALVIVVFLIVGCGAVVGIKYIQEEGNNDSSFVRKYEEPVVTVHVFYITDCPHAQKLFDYLDTLDIPFYLKKYNVLNENDEKLLKEVAKYLNFEFEGTPVMVINDKYMLGFDRSLSKDVYNLIEQEHLNYSCSLVSNNCLTDYELEAFNVVERIKDNLSSGSVNGSNESTNNNANSNNKPNNSNSNNKPNNNSNNKTCNESEKQRLKNEYETTLQQRTSDHEKKMSTAQQQVSSAKSALDTMGGYLSLSEYNTLVSQTTSQTQKKLYQLRYEASVNYDQMVKILNELPNTFNNWKNTYNDWYQTELKKLGC